METRGGTHGSNRFASARISLALDEDHAAFAMSPSADEIAMVNGGSSAGSGGDGRLISYSRNYSKNYSNHCCS